MDVVIRVTIIYLFVVFGLRVIGRRELSDMSPLDLVTLLLIPEIVAQALPGGEDFSLINGLTGIATLFLLVYVGSQWLYLKPKVEKAVEGRPTLLVESGRYIYENLDKEHVTPSEILAAVRHNGLEELEQVKWGILETDGKISIIKDSGNSPEST